MDLRKLATAAALASALTLSTTSIAATPVVASASASQDKLVGVPFLVYFMGAAFIAVITKVAVDNSTSP